MSTAIEAIRNVCFVGHPSSGKTTLVDALAHMIGVSSRKGSVADKTSICDTEPEEHDKGHTLQAAMVQGSKDGVDWTLIDTPGYPDFITDVNSAIFATDLTAGVHNAAGAVTFNFRKKMEAAGARGKGRAIIVTHVDADNVDFDAVVENLRDMVGEICVPVTVPNQTGSGFTDTESVIRNAESPWRKRLMDRIMDGCEDDALMEKYLEHENLDDDELHANLHKAIAKGTLIPVLVCNPESGLGLDDVYKFVREYAPHPDSYEQADAEGNVIELNPEGDLAAVVFDVKSDPHVGKICAARILRGTLGAHDQVATSPDTKGEKLGGLFTTIGKKREPIETAKPGEIVAFSKVDGVAWGETFTHAGAPCSPVVPPARTEPMVSLAATPKSRADEQKIGEALHKLEAEDAGFRVAYNGETHELVMQGMSELHLQVVEARLKRRYGVEIETHLPRIQYKETVTKPAEGHHRHKKQSGGRGQFAECYVRVRPLEKGAGLVFADKVVGGSIPRNLIPAVEKGVREIAAAGILTHNEVVDIELELYDGKFHDVDSDEASFKVAGARGFMDAFRKAGPILLEPQVELVISVPTESAGHIFSDITSQRRGHVLDQWTEADGAITVVKAACPLATVQTYQRDLKSQTAGEGSFTMEIVDYAPVPAQEQERILKTSAKTHDED